MGPIDYTSLQVQPDFLKNFAGGLQTGALMQQQRAQQEDRARALALQQQYQQDVAAAMQNPSPQAFSALALKYPGQHESIKQAWSQLDAARQQNELRDAGELAARLSSGDVEGADEAIGQRIDAMRAAGQPTAGLERLQKLISADPQKAYAQVLHGLSALPGSRDVLANLSEIGKERRAQELQPAAMKEAAAKAEKAAVDSKFAESNAVADLETKGWNIKKIAADIDIARQNSRIAAMNASIAREGNELKREELRMKRDAAIAAREEKIRAKVVDAESQRSTLDNFLNTADRLLKISVDSKGAPSETLLSAAGPINSRMPTMQSDVADLEALAETLGSQAFLSQIPAMKGTGSLSEKEGDKLQAALTNLSLRQSEAQFIANVKEAQRLVLKARKNIALRTGVPDTVPDTPAVRTSPADIDALVKKYGGGG